MKDEIWLPLYDYPYYFISTKRRFKVEARHVSLKYGKAGNFRYIPEKFIKIIKVDKKYKKDYVRVAYFLQDGTKIVRRINVDEAMLKHFPNV